MTHTLSFLSNYCSLITRSGSSSPSPPGEINKTEKAQKDAREQLQELVDYDIISKDMADQLSKSIPNEHTHLSVYDEYEIIFHETLPNEDGNPHTTALIFDIDTINNLNKGVSISDIMEGYYNIPEWQRSTTSTFIVGAPDKESKTDYGSVAGYFDPNRNSVNLTYSFLRQGSRYNKDLKVQQVIYHEYVHATDYALIDKKYRHAPLHYLSNYSTKFSDILKTNKATSYSESYEKGSYNHRIETLAEAVSYTRVNNSGGNLYMFTDKGPTPYKTWAKENPELSQFAQDFINCKNPNELRELFGAFY